MFNYACTVNHFDDHAYACGAEAILHKHKLAIAFNCLTCSQTLLELDLLCIVLCVEIFPIIKCISLPLS